MRMSLILALLLGGCVLPDSSYELDGVTVYLEHSVGPGQDHMAYAVGLFRSGIADRLELEADAEADLWRTLAQWRWTDDAIPGGARYEPEFPLLRTNWAGCVLSVHTYEELLEHYVDEPTEEDIAWAAQLRVDEAPKVCTRSRRTIGLPW